MSSFFRSNKSASSSSTDLAKAGPETSEIYTTPLDGVKPSKKWEYDENQIKQINELKEYTATLLLPKSDPYHPWEARFLADPGTHPRYMRASKWNINNAKTRIKSTIEWRREYQPELIKQTDVAVEAETGKIILTGFDQDARPVMYLRPGRENTETSPRQIRHLIFHLERAIDLMPPGQEQIAIIVDYKSATASSTPSIGTGRKVLSILQNHYVERLGRGLVVNMPWWMNAFFSGIMPLMDPITRDKIRFNPKLPELVPSSQLDHEFGGEYNLKFDHGVYWKSIVDFCHLADDGGRVDKDGKSWYPPSGNGIKAAVDGYAPRKGSVVTGDLAKIGSPDALPIDPSEAVTIPAGPKALEGVSNSDNTAIDKAETNGAVTSGEEANGEEANGEKLDATEQLVGSTKRLSLGERAKSTAPGAPEGTAVFDHKPTEEEIETAQAVEVKS